MTNRQHCIRLPRRILGSGFKIINIYKESRKTITCRKLKIINKHKLERQDDIRINLEGLKNGEVVQDKFVRTMDQIYESLEKNQIVKVPNKGISIRKVEVNQEIVDEELSVELSEYDKSLEDIEATVTKKVQIKQEVPDEDLKDEYTFKEDYDIDIKYEDIGIKFEESQQYYQCHICGVQYADWSKHMRAHSDENRYECNVCFKMFADFIQLILHQKQHIFECDVCQTQFAAEATLIEHKHLNHRASNVYKIEDIDAISLNGQRKSSEKTTWHLTSVLRSDTHEIPARNVNTSEKQYATSRAQDEKQLIISPPEEKPFECEICHQRFSSMWSYKRHMTSTHAQLQFLRCTICCKQFRSTNYLMEHMNKVHYYEEEPYKCVLCDARFWTRMLLACHMEEYLKNDGAQFECANCGKWFRSKWCWQKHFRTQCNL